MKLAWIGTGVMGSAMLIHLKKAGHDVSAYNRTFEKMLPLKEHGVHICESIAACVKDADVVFTMVGYPKDVEDIYTCKDGIFEHIKKGCILIDMTTSSPALAQSLYEKAKMYHAYMLDAPVSGGDSGAKSATLSIMVGGDKEVFEQAYPLFKILGTSIHYMGAAGCGQHTKACNQIAVAGAVAAMSEAIVYACKQNLPVEKMLNAISKGAAGSWQLEHTAPRVLANDFQPGFYIKHFIKDMNIIKAEMNAKDMELMMLNTVLEMYRTLAENGEENLGTQALIHYYDNDEKLI